MFTQSKTPQGGWSMAKLEVSFCGAHTNLDFTKAASLSVVL